MATSTKRSTSTTRKPATKPAMADLAKQAEAPAAPATKDVDGYKLTGKKPEQIAGRKGKPFRPNTQRAVVWDFMQAQLANGPVAVEALYEEMLAKAPAPRVKGKISGKQSAPSGWYGRYEGFGLIARCTIKVPVEA